MEDEVFLPPRGGPDRKEKTLTIGPYPEISLNYARDQRDEARRDLRMGIDPGLESGLKLLLADNVDLRVSVGANYVDARKKTTDAFAPVGVDAVQITEQRWSVPVDVGLNYRFSNRDSRGTSSFTQSPGVGRSRSGITKHPIVVELEADGFVRRFEIRTQPQVRPTVQRLDPVCGAVEFEQIEAAQAIRGTR